jgi:anti-anti-sigma factor
MTQASFRVQLDRRGDAWTINCSGDLDGAAAWHLSDAVELCLDADPSSVFMDCTGVTFIDSGGLWALLRAAREAHERTVSYHASLSAQVREVVQRAGILERLLSAGEDLAPIKR